ncbi:MAG: acyl--CoA ligase [Gemmatimonadaceae bacterium]|nr:acyl--CoA ligase [Gemmatimonadaceae bacterium]
MPAIPLLAHLTAWAERAPGDPAAQQGDEVWSTGELLRQADVTAHLLQRHGVRAGDRVAWHGGSSLDFAAVLLATWRLDATYVGINPRYTDREVRDVLARTSPAVVLTPSSLRDARRRTDAAALPAALPEPRGDRPALLVFTTGSTGRPKVAVLPHRGIAAASATQAAAMRSHARRTINALPANHIGGIVNITTATWWAHETVDFVPVFSPAAIIERLNATSDVRLAAVPMLFQRCLEAPDFAAAARGRLVHALSGGAPLPATVCERLRALDVTVQGMYGQSEVCGSVCFTGLQDDTATTCDTVGWPVPGMELRLGPLDGSAGAGDEGEVQVRGAQLFTHYLDDPGATRAAVTADGWLRTGDLGARRPDGALRLTGRLKELINTGGHKVMPGEVERVLMAHPQVATAVVLGTPDAAFGETVAAAIVTRDGRSAEWPVLERWCRDQLANYKVPKRWMQVDALPLLGVGKVDRQALTAQLTANTHD